MQFTRQDIDEYDIYMTTIEDCLERAKIQQRLSISADTATIRKIERHWFLHSVESMRSAHRYMIKIYGQKGLVALRQKVLWYWS